MIKYLVCLAWVLFVAVGRGESPQPVTIQREIFVPFSDLHVILAGDAQRVFMSREEYETLAAKAKLAATPQKSLQPAAVLSADYSATIEDNRARISGTLIVAVPDEQLHAINLDLSGVALQSANLDDKPAALGRNAAGMPVLFVSGAGRHTLQLEIIAGIETATAQRMLTFQIPTPPASQLAVTVAGNVEIKSGASIIERTYDEADANTSFKLLPHRGPNTLVLSLNNRQLQKDRTVVAHAVLVDEIHEAFEQLHATLSMSVLHGVADAFRFEVPNDFELLSVTGPQIARWAVAADGDRRVLEVRLHEPTSDTVTFNLVAVRTPALLKDWHLPKFVALDVAGQAMVIGLIVETRLKPQNLRPRNLVSIDAGVLAQAMPATRGEAATEPTHQVELAAFYAPHGDYDLQADFQVLPSDLQATTGVFVSLTDKLLEARGSFTLLDTTNKLLDFSFFVPHDWQVAEVTLEGGAAVPFENVTSDEGKTRVHVRLPQAAEIGESKTVYFRAVSTPADWLENWSSKTLQFPLFQIVGTSREVGAIAVQARDDMQARADAIDRLTPLDANEKSTYGLADVTTDMAFRYDAPPYALTYNVTRLAPRLSARAFSFFRVEQDLLIVHNELGYDISEARTSELTFALPLDTPAEVGIRGLDGVAIKEATSKVVGQDRLWSVRLAEPQSGTIRVAIDFQQPLVKAERRTGPAVAQNASTVITLPVIRALGVAYQTGTIAVEGNVELETQVKTKLRKVDVGELAEADYQPGRRLLGAYGYSGDVAKTELVVERPPGYDLPTVLVERAELVTAVSSSGQSQTAARFQLRAKAQLVEVRLPENSTLWSVHLDGQPVLPQREPNSLLIGIPATSAAVGRNLQLVYETPVAELGLAGGLALTAPRLLLRSEAGQPGEEVPLADLLWQLTLPSGYRVVSSNGTVFTQDIATRESPVRVAVRAMIEHSPFAARRQYSYSSDVAAGKASPAPSMVDESKSMSEYARSDRYADPSLAETTATEEPSDQFIDAEKVHMDDADSSASQSQLAPQAPPVVPRPHDLPTSITPDTSGVAPAPSIDAPQTNAPGERAAGGFGLSNGAFGPVAKPQWAFEGLRSLPIELQTDGPQTAFQSLGEAPQLNVTVVDHHRFSFLGWAVALLVLLRGVWLTNASLASRFRYLLSVTVVALALPLALPWIEPLAPACDMVFFAACWLAAYYIVAAIAKGVWHLGQKAGRNWLPQRSAAAVIGVGTLIATQLAHAEEPPLPPVKVPANAIIVPYDATTEDPVKFINRPALEAGIPPQGTRFGMDKNRKILVPYSTFLELKKATDPSLRPTVTPPVAFAFAGANYSATLDGGESLVIEGRMEIDVFVEHAVSVPMSLAGGVLTKINVDGEEKSASMGLTAMAPPADTPNQAAKQQRARPQPPAAPALTLLLTGRGRHQVDLALRFRLQRSGGWQMADGKLPVAPASALVLTIPKGSTEVMLRGVADRGTFETKADGDKIESALSSDGTFHLQWRPKLGRAPIDQSLTATALAVFDVQEDGLRLDWKFDLAFRRSQRESFTVELPVGFGVEKVSGTNVRAWSVTDAVGEPKLEITLLKPAQESESFSVVLAKRGKVGAGELAKFSVPVLNVAGASQQSGQLSICRSPLMELRTETIEDVARANSAPIAADSNESPLGIVPYQTYRFARTPFTIDLVAKPVVARVVTELQTVLKVAERQRTLESRIRVRVQDRPIFRLRVALPNGWKLDRVNAPEPFQWVETAEDDRRIVSFYFASGQRQSFDIILMGTLGDYGPVTSLDLPRLEVLDADEQSDIIEQSGEIVVQTDPALGARAEALVECETELLSVANMWLQPAQQSLARLAIRYRSPRYSGKIQLSRRKPIVRCDTVTNVRVTQRIVEETILLNFTIQDAGVREIVFLLPAEMRNARVSAPLLRQKTIEELEDAGEPFVRVRLALQEEVLHDFRVLVEHDRLLTDKAFSSPIPRVETGQTDHRYVTLESAGRDEVIVTESQGIDPLRQEQLEWRMLTGMLGRGLTQAYLVKSSATDPKLVLRAQDRAAVETAGARIGLAQTTLIVDPNGAYRGEQLYRVDNSLEQYLEIELPSGARLWTAHVGGEPVKPAAGKHPNTVRIPLVKTAPGDADYAVVLKYGGQLGLLRAIDRLQFPFIRALNINVELSQVELHVPATHQWLNFGGTMRVVASEGDLAAGQIAYNTKQVGLALQAIRSSDSYTRARAANNLKNLQIQSEALKQSAQSYSDNQELNEQLQSNSQKLESATLEIRRGAERAETEEVFGNRSKLNLVFTEQFNGRANDVVQQAGQNFEIQSRPAKPADLHDDEQGQSLNAKWLLKNKLDGDQRSVLGEPVAPKKPLAPETQPTPQADFGKLTIQGKANRESEPMQDSSDKKQRRTLERYQQRLEEQQSQQPFFAPQRGSESEQLEGRRPTITGGTFPGGQSTVGTDSEPAAPAANLPPTQIDAPPSSSLASLNVDLQPRGIKYLLTTPRGDVQVTAQAVSSSLLGRIVRLLAIAVVVGLVLTFTGRISHGFKKNLEPQKSTA
jgi:hypothetical protein